MIIGVSNHVFGQRGGIYPSSVSEIEKWAEADLQIDQKLELNMTDGERGMIVSTCLQPPSPAMTQPAQIHHRILRGLQLLDFEAGRWEIGPANPLTIYTPHARSVLMRYVNIGRLTGMRWAVFGDTRPGVVIWNDIVEMFSHPEILPLEERKAFSDDRIRSLLFDGARVSECENSGHQFPYLYNLWQRIRTATTSR